MAKFRGEELQKLKKLVEQNPDASLQELLDASGVKASIMAVSRALERLDYHFKKSLYGRRNKTAPMLKSGVKRGAKKHPNST